MVSTLKSAPAALLLALFAATPSVAAPAAAPGAPALFCCGRICADSFPEQCRGKAYRVLDSKGNVIKEVAAPATAEQKAAAEAAEQQRKDQEAHAKDQRRRDQALLDTYANVKEIDQARERAEANLLTAIKNSEAQLEALRKKRKQVETDRASGAMPPAEADKALKVNTHETGLQEELRAGKQRDLDGVRARYDGDRKRFLELKGN